MGRGSFCYSRRTRDLVVKLNGLRVLVSFHGSIMEDVVTAIEFVHIKRELDKCMMNSTISDY